LEKITGNEHCLYGVTSSAQVIEQVGEKVPSLFAFLWSQFSGTGTDDSVRSALYFLGHAVEILDYVARTHSRQRATSVSGVNFVEVFE
jgi:hypothetical protein